MEYDFEQFSNVIITGIDLSSPEEEELAVLYAQARYCQDMTGAQGSLAWMLHKYPNVVPIPGSKNKERIIENLDSASAELTDEEFAALEEALNGLKVYGHRGLGGF